MAWWESLSPSPRLDDRRQEPPEDALGDLIQKLNDPHYLHWMRRNQYDETEKIRQHIMYGQNTPVTPLGKSLGVHQIEDTGPAARWIRQQGGYNSDAFRKLLMGLQLQ